MYSHFIYILGQNLGKGTLCWIGTKIRRTSGGRSVGIVRSRSKRHGVVNLDAGHINVGIHLICPLLYQRINA
jgi:hypothetical protein